jgi:hypothetical protein
MNKKELALRMQGLKKAPKKVNPLVAHARKEFSGYRKSISEYMNNPDNDFTNKKK